MIPNFLFLCCRYPHIPITLGHKSYSIMLFFRVEYEYSGQCTGYHKDYCPKMMGHKCVVMTLVMLSVTI